MKTNIIATICILFTSMLASCTSGQHHRHSEACYTGGHQQGRPQAHYAGRPNHHYVGRPTHDVQREQEPIIKENGQVGRMMVHRVNGVVVETRWVPGNTDPDTFEGRPVHHHEHTRVKDTDLKETIDTLLAKMKAPTKKTQ